MNVVTDVGNTIEIERLSCAPEAAASAMPKTIAIAVFVSRSTIRMLFLPGLLYTENLPNLAGMSMMPLFHWLSHRLISGWRGASYTIMRASAPAPAATLRGSDRGDARHGCPSS